MIPQDTSNSCTTQTYLEPWLQPDSVPREPSYRIQDFTSELGKAILNYFPQVDSATIEDLVEGIIRRLTTTPRKRTQSPTSPQSGPVHRQSSASLDESVHTKQQVVNSLANIKILRPDTNHVKAEQSLLESIKEERHPETSKCLNNTEFKPRSIIQVYMDQQHGP